MPKEFSFQVVGESRDGVEVRSSARGTAAAVRLAQDWESAGVRRLRVIDENGESYEVARLKAAYNRPA